MLLVEKALYQIINQFGSIGIDRFMKLTTDSYYNRSDTIGHNGDFITAPEISQMFGEMIGIWCLNEFLKKPAEDFYLVELGAGLGTMLEDLLRIACKNNAFSNHLKKIIILEASSTLKRKQLEKLFEYSDRIIWIKSIEELPKGNLIIVANEFLDVLPIRQFLRKGNKFYEIGITVDDSGLNYTVMHETTITSIDDCPQDGIIEICPDLISVVNSICVNGKNNISALFIDYGYIEPTFHSTLQALKNHKFNDVLQNIGQCDITAHVDFKALAKFFLAKGMQVNISTQGEFLKALGIEFRAQTLIKYGAQATSISQDLNRLISPQQMGNLFKVLEATTVK